MISGHIKPTLGNVFFQNKLINNLSLVNRSCLGIGRKFQTPTVFDNLNVERNIELSILRHNLSKTKLFKKKKINKEIFELSNEDNVADKGDYKDFMSKEINEQNITAKTCVKEYVDHLRKDINLYNFPITPKDIQKIVLIGCGTAYHSCATAKYWFEDLTNIPIEIDIASEFRYRKIRFNKKNLYVFVSQSGETADTFAALDLCKKNKAKTCSVVNVVESSIARSSDFVLPIHAGPEIGVASVSYTHLTLPTNREV